MIITENREKVKRKVLSLINKGDKDLSKPEKKFMVEMIMGMLMTGSSNLTEISRSLKEKISIKDTSKRLLRMLSKDSILDIANKISLDQASPKIDSQSILALDTGDITHQYGRKFENINTVHDGSSNSLKQGYWLNQITCYAPASEETFPVLLDIYSSKEKGFKSSNTESIEMVDKVRNKISGTGLWVMDRGYDRNEIFDYFLRNSLDFLIRMQSRRNLVLRSKSYNIKELALGINRRTKYSTHSRFGSKKIYLNIKGYNKKVTLICLKNKGNKQPIFWLANGWLKSTKEIKRRIRGYFKRWSVEESYRFEKQGFGIEKATVRKYSKIKTLLGLTVMSWLLLVKINEAPKLKEIILSKAKMEKNKRKQRPKFIYYRLLKGVQNLFEGINELFRFRMKRKNKDKIRQQYLIHCSLFPDMQRKLLGLEI